LGEKSGMKNCLEVDYKNYDASWGKQTRYASRGIIMNGSLILLVYSKKGKFYKFPGGGIMKGESEEHALIREISEEAGATVIDNTLREYGVAHEIMKSPDEANTIYEQYSYYYYIDVEPELIEQQLDDYEEELKLVPVWADLREAYLVNKAYNENNPKYTYILREELMMKQLLDKINE